MIHEVLYKRCINSYKNYQNLINDKKMEEYIISQANNISCDDSKSKHNSIRSMVLKNGIIKNDEVICDYINDLWNLKKYLDINENTFLDYVSKFEQISNSKNRFEWFLIAKQILEKKYGYPFKAKISKKKSLSKNVVFSSYNLIGKKQKICVYKFINFFDQTSFDKEIMKNKNIIKENETYFDKNKNLFIISNEDKFMGSSEALKFDYSKDFDNPYIKMNNYFSDSGIQDIICDYINDSLEMSFFLRKMGTSKNMII